MIQKLITLITFIFITGLPQLSAENGISVKLNYNKALSKDTVPPQFPEGEKALVEYMEGNIRYPYILAKIEMEGDVDARFTINKGGRPQDIEIIKGFDPLADEEVIRVIQEMPLWVPAMVNNNVISMEQQLTVSFSLNDTLRQETELLNNGETNKTNYLKSRFEREGKIKKEGEDISGNDLQQKDNLSNTNIQPKQLPEFPGGKQALDKFIADNLKYPKRAAELRIEGSVIFNITVSSEGEITRIGLMKGLYYECNDEAFYVVKKMPKWTPGMIDGKPATMDVILPIPFKLSK